MTYDNRPIGVFDSGLGGLTVISALRQRLKNEDFIYLGDTARVPYGSKSKETITQFAIEDSRFLLSKQVKMIVVACNSASAMAFDQLVEQFPDTPFISVVQAGVDSVLADKSLSKVLVLGTNATINSDRYRILIHSKRPEIVVNSVACPLFVPLVESFWTEGEIAEKICEAYLNNAIESKPDALVLACTHYPLLKNLIQKYIPKDIRLIDSSIACSKSVEEFLTAQKIKATPDNIGCNKYYVTDMPVSFYKIASHFLSRKIDHVEKVKLQ